MKKVIGFDYDLNAIENAFKRQKIFIQGKNEKLDFTYIKDLANGSILAARKKKGINQIFNITCGKGQTLFSYVSYLKSEFLYFCIYW